MSENASKDSVRNVLNDFESIRDEARLKLHLLSMDARDSLKDLEGKADDLQRDLENNADQLGAAAASKAKVLAQQARSFVESHLKAKHG